MLLRVTQNGIERYSAGRPQLADLGHGFSSLALSNATSISLAGVLSVFLTKARYHPLLSRGHLERTGSAGLHLESQAIAADAHRNLGPRAFVFWYVESDLR